MEQKKHLDQLFNSFVLFGERTQQIKPVVQWAQSKNNILLNLKFSLRPDSPACVACKQDKIELKEDSVLVSYLGVLSSTPIHFLLELKLEKKINVTTSFW